MKQTVKPRCWPCSACTTGKSRARSHRADAADGQRCRQGLHLGPGGRPSAAHGRPLKSQGWSRDPRWRSCQELRLVADAATWRSGWPATFRLPLYPTLAPDTVRQILTHSESKACFVGKLDGWEGMKPGVPAGLPCISYPLSPPDAIKDYEGWTPSAAHATAAGQPVRAAEELATLIYTSAPRRPKRDARLRQFRLGAGLRPQAHPISAEDRMLSTAVATSSSACSSSTAG